MLTQLEESMCIGDLMWKKKRSSRTAASGTAAHLRIHVKNMPTGNFYKNGQKCVNESLKFNCS